MQDLGPPVAYLALTDGTPVFDRNDQRVGVVEHVHTEPLPGRHLYADADQIADMRERGVVLAVEQGDLHEPSEPSTRPSGEGDEDVPLEARLRRAWDWISAHL
jgi:hypothetical protein